MNTIKAFLFITFFVFQSLPGIAPRYQLVDLGLQSYTSSQVSSINEKGFICGYLKDGNRSSIFVIDPDKKIATRKEALLRSRFKINNHNEIFGSIEQRISDGYWEFSNEMIFKWKNPFNYIQYFNFKHVGLPTGQRSTADVFKNNVVWDANDLGQILVMDSSTFSDAMDEMYINSVWIYDKDVYHKIVHPQFEAGFKMNNRSQVVGCYHTGSSLHKNRISHTSIYDFSANAVTLLEFPGSSIGEDINDQGQVVGIFYNPEEKMIMGFFAAPSGESTPIVNFKPRAINNNGTVIGTYLYDKKKNQLAVWENGVFYDVSALTSMMDDNGNSWESLDSLVDINDQNEIIGNGTIGGKKHGFLLKPIRP